jgi:hypothetical protein
MSSSLCPLPQFISICFPITRVLEFEPPFRMEYYFCSFICKIDPNITVFFLQIKEDYFWKEGERGGKGGGKGKDGIQQTLFEWLVWCETVYPSLGRGPRSSPKQTSNKDNAFKIGRFFFVFSSIVINSVQ